MARRYRAGWLIPKHVLALTHFVPEVSHDDFMGIATDTAQALEAISGNFYLIIDNRIIQNTDLAPLSMMLQAMPNLNHPQLQSIVMIVPDALEQAAETIPDQQQGHITLHHVDNLDEAYTYLREHDSGIMWNNLDTQFFVA